MSIIYIKLINGEEIIGEIVKESHDTSELTLKNVLTIEQYQDSGKFLLNSFVPIIGTPDIDIRSQNIMVKCDVPENLEKYYRMSVTIAHKFNETTNSSMETAVESMQNYINSLGKGSVEVVKPMSEEDGNKRILACNVHDAPDKKQ